MKPGIHKDMSITDYHLDREVISSSAIKEARKSSRNFLHYLVHGKEGKSYFDFGNAFELALMDEVNGTDYFSKEVAVMPSEKWIEQAKKEKDLKVPKSSKHYQVQNKAFVQENFDKYIIVDTGAESYERIKEMITSVKADFAAWKLLSNTEYQVSLCWKDEDTGLLCKTRPDVCRTKHNVIVDIKTTSDASPQGFARQAANLDYPLQAIMQIEGAQKAGLMESVDKYFWLAVEKGEVVQHGLYEFSADDMEYYTDMYHFYLKRCSNALSEFYKENKGVYSVPSYGENADNRHGILTLEIPLWYRA